MKDKLINAKNSAKEFVVKHKVAIAVVSTAAICGKINSYAIGQHNDFLREKGLYDEFYTPTDEDGNEK